MSDYIVGEVASGKRRPILRIIIALVLILGVAGFVVFGDSERLAGWFLFSADRPSAAVVEKPKEASPAAVDEAVKRYFSVANTFIGSRAGLQALNKIGAIAMARGEYELARQAYEPVCTRYSQLRDDCQISQIFIARSYEAQGQLDKAEQVYLDLERFYVWTPIWIQAPAYPAQMYERHGELDKANLAYQRAKETCLKRIKITRDPDAVIQLAWQLIQIYEGLGNWQGAQQQLRNIIDSGILGSDKKPEFIFKLATVLERHFRYAEAKAFFLRLIEEFPNSPQVPEARRILATIAAG